ncbi:paramyosin [Nematostella vectensis]|uniref:paramyosin n=1 Tax=Nematostella vectensis TaxID=45351 RepID=UPI00138FFB7D|nr:paramyosin [Nematostella vectensis]
MDQIDDIERVLRDISREAHVKSLDAFKSNDFKGHYKAKLQNAEGYLDKLKTNYTALETKSLFLENLAKDPESWPTLDGIEDHYTSMNTDAHMEMKNVAEDLEDEVESMANQLQEKKERLQEQLESLEAKLASVKEKKLKYELLKEKTDQEKLRKHAKENMIKIQREQEQKKKQSDFAIKQCNTAIRSLEQCLEILRGEVEVCRKQTELAKYKLQEEETKTNNQVKKREDRYHWLNGVVKLLESLQGLAVRDIGDDILVLELKQPRVDDDSLFLTLKFRLCQLSCPSLCGAELNPDTLSIDDLVTEAVENGDAVALVHGVQARLKEQQCLREEIGELQKIYAMDWEPGAKRLRVMLGRSGKTVCTLGLGLEYPAQGSVSLLKVEGTQQQDLTKIQAPSPSATLSTWIRHLQQVFSIE